MSSSFTVHLSAVRVRRSGETVWRVGEASVVGATCWDCAKVLSLN